MDFALTEEQEAIRKMVREFAAKEIEPRIHEINEKGVFHTPVIRKAAELGLLGMTVPSEYGGTGTDFVSYCIMIEEVSRVCGSTGLTLAAHCGLGTSHIAQGTEEQKRAYLPKLASGERIGAWALTEPGSGSDAAALATTAVRKGNEWILNGEKTFCTNAHFADVITVMAKTDPGKGTKGITAFIVPKGTPGLKMGKLEEKLGLHGSATSQFFLEDARVPHANVVGGDAGVGAGFVGALKTLDSGRIAIGAWALGIAQGALDASLAYAKERQQFGKPIGAFQAIGFKLATMATEIDAAR